MRYLYTVVLLLACCIANCYGQTNAYNYKSVKQIRVKNGAVVSAHPLASAAGAEILKKGGNAVDAAIATQLALAVVYPNAGNLGGGGFMVLHSSKGEQVTYDYREMAPGRASRDMFIDTAGNADTSLSQSGHLASGVPGTVAGLFLSHKEHGRLPMAALIDPAIKLAEKGFVITGKEAAGLNALRDDFLKFNRVKPAFVKDGSWKAGDTLFQPHLAHTLQLIKEKGAAGFYEGETAQKIVDEMQHGKGIITLDDLKQYKAIKRSPVTFDYKGYKIVTMPLPSSGGIMLQQMLGILERYPLDKYGFDSPEAMQLMIEVERRVYADRAAFMGDPGFVKVPVTALTSPAYLAQRMSDYKPGKASESKNIHHGSPQQEHEETTHLSVVDNQGNAVAVTTTLNGSYGSRVVVGNAGFILNNEMDDFSAKPGVPNMYGLLGSEANAIAPYKRMLSSMTPTIVLHNGLPYLVAGTPGGSTIITSVLQTLVNVIDFGLSIHDAVNLPKFHHQWQPDLVYVEKGFSAETLYKLRGMGYHIYNRNGIGRTEVIRIKDGIIEAVADGRGEDSAAGY
ncbi:gamma-glutamyltransferase [Filimonas effusa]|uniref:Glutathione hydrolase proenzyme n=1 Tax=Filimonas effusa TaxID=2508721 RepID=A0A4Q1DCP0_9BACT|nr:gamma-glutamyltransferase [Filimonas effusa]RXK87237.1 gamma-glutamyltransferase [Filimonas effusa]